MDANFLLTALTVDEASGVIEFCSREGFERLRVLGLARQGRASKNWEVIKAPAFTEGEAIRAIEDQCLSARLQVEFVGFPGQTPCAHADEHGHCLGGLRLFHVATDGRLFPCPSVKAIPERAIGQLAVGDAPEALLSARLPVGAICALQYSLA